MIEFDLIDNSQKIDINLTDYNDTEIRHEIDELQNSKVDKIEGKGLSTNDYTTPEKEKLASLENYDDTEVRELIDTKQPRGNYLTEESDPTVPSHVKSITQNNITNWNNKAEMSDIPDVSEFITKNVNDLTYYTTTANLANVSLSGSYNDLINTPDLSNFATTTALGNEKTARENADTGLQNQINVKQDTLISGTNIKTINNESLLGSGNIDIQGGGTSDYSNLTNKPSINNVTLSGNKSLSDLGIQPAGSYATTIDLEDKQNIEDNNLETTRKTIVGAINEVNDVAKGSNQALSFANYSTMVTTFNSLDDDEYHVGQNLYIVTVNVPDLWISSVESTSSTYTYTTDSAFISSLQTNGYVQVGYYKLSMLETQKVDLTNYVTTTDYASYTTAGVIKPYGDYSTSINEHGRLYARVSSYSEYGQKPTTMFISKGTLENVLTGKGYGTYSLPSGGIPKTDLSSGVQSSLDLADSALQSYTEQYTGTITGITMNGSSKGTSGVVDLGTVITSHQDISGKLDVNKVKNTMSTTAGDVYDVRYINTVLGDIETLLSEV